ncbi:hypothetical protein [Paracoccus sp. DMF]|uniref:hypothetical protein n=1 Tax=Paracoccus sp. DMF TaxID=400837 RepID=UPI001104CE21|nr:hypothetical protein [Paracoccus sp. DMF]MCV2448476.1 hypothetical protein [Paracoccus sp. DMF]
MTYYFDTPMTAADLTAKVEAMLTAAKAMEPLAKAMAEFEAATGRKLVLTEEGTRPAISLDALLAGVPQDAPPAAQDNAPAPESGIPATRVAKTEDAAPAPRTAPLRAAAEKQRIADWARLTPTERRVVEHLEGLPDTFTPDDDEHLVDMLIKGNKLDIISALLGIDADALKARWNAMVRHPELRAANGKGASLNGQQRLLAAVRYRAKEAAQ